MPAVPCTSPSLPLSFSFDHKSGAPPIFERVVITGLGCVTPSAPISPSSRPPSSPGRTGIAEFGLLPEAVEGQNGIKFNRMASVPNFDPDQHLSTGVVTATNRTTQFAIVAARQAAAQSDLMKHYAPEDIAIILGCSCGGRSSEEIETAKLYYRNARVHPLTVTRTMASAGGSHISIDLGITGPVLISRPPAPPRPTPSAPPSIWFGLECPKPPSPAATRPRSPSASCARGTRCALSLRQAADRFSADRDGMTLGEGAGMIVLEPA